MHRLVEPRHRGHDGRAHLEHVGGERLDALGEIDLGAERDREQQAAGVLVGVRQRQERQEDLVAEPDRLEEPHAPWQLARMLPCVVITPLGSPPVPEV